MTVASVVVNGKLQDDINHVSAGDVSNQLTNGSTEARSMYYLQWALAQTGNYTGAIDGTMRSSVQTALDATRGQSYGIPKYAPLTGPSVSTVFLTDFFRDYLNTPVTKIVNP